VAPPARRRARNGTVENRNRARTAGIENRNRAPDDRRPVTVWLADPATLEEYVLSWGICTRADFTAAMSRTNKSGHLFTALSRFITGLSLTDADKLMTSRVSRPGLCAADLDDIVTLMGWAGHTTPSVLTAVCSHPRIARATLAKVLCVAGVDIAHDVAEATGSLLPAAIWWVRANIETAPAAKDSLALIDQTHARWTSWAGTDPGRFSFLLNTSFAMAGAGREDDMLAAGDAILTAGART